MNTLLISIESDPKVFLAFKILLWSNYYKELVIKVYKQNAQLQHS